MFAPLKTGHKQPELGTKKFFSDILVQLHSVDCVQALAEPRVPLLTFFIWYVEFAIFNTQETLLPGFRFVVGFSGCLIVLSSFCHRLIIIFIIVK